MWWLGMVPAMAEAITRIIERRRPLLTLSPERRRFALTPEERRRIGITPLRELTPEERRRREDELLRGLILRRELFPAFPVWGMPLGLRRFPLLSPLARMGALRRIPFGRIW